MAQYGDNDPIAACATAAGKGALAVIRAAGEGTLEMLADAFSRKQKLLQAPGGTIVLGWILDKDGNRIDEVLVSVYRSPRSYTGEDAADISCHGGNATVRGILSALRAVGFRDGLPGEFTFRAFINGKLDLTRAESVMELVSAQTDTSRARAVQRLSGALETEINAVKGLLVQVLAGTEIFLDYAEDEFSGTTPEEAAGALPYRQLAEESLSRLHALAASFRIERLYQEGALAVIAGRPNVGKSSLFNRLLQEDRSIVAETPGTTRDWIEGGIVVEGIPVRLADTAGLHDTENTVEKIGIERSRDLAAAADLILYLIDSTEGITNRDAAFLSRAAPPLICVWNKADIAPPPPAALGISAKTGEGISALINAVADTLTTSADYREAHTDRHALGIASARQQTLISAAAETLAQALALSAAAQPLDLIAPLLRESVNALGEITGEVSTADILETMFSAFCVGK